jgi:CYTH domain-containing protein
VAQALIARTSRGKEIERKYLLRELPILPDDATVVEIEQGYVPGTEVLERLRRVRSVDGDAIRHERTVKIGSGLVRTEIEEEISRELFARMWSLTEGKRIHKRRYAARGEKHTWEIDDFLDRNLVLAEVELRTADEEAALPAWLEVVVVRDVTGEREYENATLASGDGRVAEEAEEELEEQDAGDSGGEHATDDARIAHERRPPSLADWRREQPAVG